MKTSRKGFVGYLENRLTPESAKSYLSYVDAFSKAVRKDDNYFFSSSDKSEELEKLLQGGINRAPSFLKHSPKFQSNIKTGIRALLKYYLAVDNAVVKKEDIVKISPNLTRTKVIDHYAGKFGKWLENLHIKSNGERFRSAANYEIGLKRAIEDLQIDPREFFSYTKKVELDIFHAKLKSNKHFWDRSEAVQHETTSSLNKYKFYLGEKYGWKMDNLF